MIVREHINEQYDSPEYKKHNFSKDEFKELAFADPYASDKSANLFQSGLYHGKGSGELNSLIADATFSSRNKDATGVMEHLYSVLVKFIPEFKEYKINEYSSESPIQSLSLRKTIPLKDNVSGEEHKIEINLWIVYHIKGDKIFNYKKDKIKLLFIPTIKANDRYAQKQINNFGNNILSFSIENNELTDDDINKEMSKLQKSLANMPDEQDTQIIKNIEIYYKNLTLPSFIKLIPRLKTNLSKFHKYISEKYGV